MNAPDGFVAPPGSFAWALLVLDRGYSVCRPHWAGGSHLEPDYFGAADHKPLLYHVVGQSRWAFTADQDDMLAQDWQEFEEETE